MPNALIVRAQRLVLKFADTKEELEACFAVLHDARSLFQRADEDFRQLRRQQSLLEGLGDHGRV